MKWINFLHFYQPSDQQEDILIRIVNECYRPLIKGFLDNPRSKAVFNINGALIQLLIDNKYEDLIINIKKLLDRGQIEMTSSAMYHAFLPLLPEEEIKRQIELNDRVNKKHFGKNYNPIGFFSPEMAVNSKIFKVTSEMGYKWISAPQVSYGSNIPKPDKFYIEEKHGQNVFFRNKDVSMILLNAITHKVTDFLFMIKRHYKKDMYIFTIMDAETFGHHRIGYEDHLFDLTTSKYFDMITIKDLLKKDYDSEKVHVRASTWTNEEQDFWLDKERTSPTEGKSFILWKDPENPLHTLQWNFLDYVLKSINSYNNKKSVKWKKAREKMDTTINSDPFWWASTKPWWSLEIVEQGAYEFKEILNDLYDSKDSKSKEVTKRSEDFYRKIIDLAFFWQRSGYIRKKHINNSSTFMKEPFSKRTPSDWSNLIILELEAEMNLRALKQDFELAIKWRDAVIKISKGTDIYDILHVVDELWSARSLPQLKAFFDHDWHEMSAFAKEHLVDIKNKKDFEKAKKEYLSNAF